MSSTSSMSETIRAIGQAPRNGINPFAGESISAGKALDRRCHQNICSLRAKILPGNLIGAPMTDLLSLVASPIWWFSTVVVALVVNMIAPSLAGLLSGTASRISIGWSNRSKRSRAVRIAEIKRLVESPVALGFAKHREIRHRTDYVIFMLITCITFAVAVMAKSKGFSWAHYLLIVGGLISGSMATAFIARFNRLQMNINAAEHALELLNHGESHEVTRPS